MTLPVFYVQSRHREISQHGIEVAAGKRVMAVCVCLDEPVTKNE